MRCRRQAEKSPPPEFSAESIAGGGSRIYLGGGVINAPFTRARTGGKSATADDNDLNGAGNAA